MYLLLILSNINNVQACLGVCGIPYIVVHDGLATNLTISLVIQDIVLPPIDPNRAIYNERGPSHRPLKCFIKLEDISTEDSIMERNFWLDFSSKVIVN